MELSVRPLKKCNSCGAPLDSTEDSATVKCPVCGHFSSTGRPSASSVHTDTLQQIIDLLLRIYSRVLIFLILYILSTGPMYWLIYGAFNASGSTFLAKMYYPIALLCEMSETVCNWFDWYVGLWVYR